LGPRPPPLPFLDFDGSLAVSEFGFGHPGPFYRVPLSQCFRAYNALTAALPYQPVLSRAV